MDRPTRLVGLAGAPRGKSRALPCLEGNSFLIWRGQLVRWTNEEDLHLLVPIGKTDPKEKLGVQRASGQPRLPYLLGAP